MLMDFEKCHKAKQVPLSTKYKNPWPLNFSNHHCFALNPVRGHEIIGTARLEIAPLCQEGYISPKLSRVTDWPQLCFIRHLVLPCRPQAWKNAEVAEISHLL